jgi:hypothetical protein
MQQPTPEQEDTELDQSLKDTIRELDILQTAFVETMTRLRELALQKFQQQQLQQLQQQQQQQGVAPLGLNREYVAYTLELPPYFLPPSLDGVGCGSVLGDPLCAVPPYDLIGGGLGAGYWKKRDAEPCWWGGWGLPLGGYGYGGYPAYPYYPYGGYGGLGLSFYGRGGYYGLY